MYFVSNLLLFSEELNRQYVLDAYSLRKESFGLGIQKKENADSLWTWYHFAKEFRNSFRFALQLSAISHSKKKLEVDFFSSKYQFPFSSSEQLITISPGFRYSYIHFYTKFYSNTSGRYDAILGLWLYKEKSVLLSYSKNSKEQSHSFSFSILTGKNPTIALGLGKEYKGGNTEWIVNLGVSFGFDSYETGISYLPRTEKEDSGTFVFASRSLKEKEESLFGEEMNPYVDNGHLPEKREQVAEIRIKKRERVVYEISIDELLKFRIPLAIAIRIHRASKSKEDYLELLKRLPADLVRKCNKIQFDKARKKN
ncbi:MAG TPA: hypothetical protein PKL30_25310 [Leptospiraceae bacterium]|nr:hypothetical protein [Leptospiraceae bacterium]HMX33852.1 hypothetical protein [Leptospiraceae bacterium]HMY33361.1 hypothetical protein [Leptospiraceae bacterium]HNA07502.1 hypothetical protein [Leptospiraceae bacterium]HNB96938.1 hypothetical protein [Leptospiraceae bacterium]